MSYKLQANGVQRLSDNAFIPDTPGNRDWKAYQKWLAEGNIPQPADPPPQPTPQELRERLYPSVWTYLEALYQARQGNTAALAAIDQIITQAFQQHPDQS